MLKPRPVVIRFVVVAAFVLVAAFRLGYRTTTADDQARAMIAAEWIGFLSVAFLLGGWLFGSTRMVLALGIPTFWLFGLPILVTGWLGPLSPAASWALAIGALGAIAAFPYLANDGGTIAPRRLWWVALWLALALSLADNLCRLISRGMYGPMPVDPDDIFTVASLRSLWLVPLGVALALGACAFFISLPACLRRRRPLPRQSVFLLLFAVWLTLVSRVGPVLHIAAIMLVTVGLAYRSTAWICAKPHAFDRLVDRTFPWLAGACAGLAIAGQVLAITSERRALASLPPPSGNPPNVLLIVLDTVRAESLSLYGYKRPTSPQLSKLAAKGVVFEQAIAPSSWTLPTHASLFTGVLPHDHKADTRSALGGDLTTLAEALAARGYQTAGFVANRGYCGAFTGLARGFLHYDDHGHPVAEMALNTALSASVFKPLLWSPRKTAVDINHEFLSWLDGRRQRPFFAFLNYFDAHEPYYVPDAAFDRFGNRSPAERQHLLRSCPLEKGPTGQAAIDTYDGAIAYLDYHLGELFKELDRRSLLEDTLVVITSDHGESFGEQGIFGHGWSLYRQLIDVPLVILPPNQVPAGARIQLPIPQLDVAATILNAVTPARVSELPGRSLARFWQSGSPSTEINDRPILSELMSVISDRRLMHLGPVFSLMRSDLHYIYFDGIRREQLFDARSDPRDGTDLVTSALGAAALPSFRAQLSQDLRQFQVPVEPSRTQSSAPSSVTERGAPTKAIAAPANR